MNCGAAGIEVAAIVVHMVATAFNPALVELPRRYRAGRGKCDALVLRSITGDRRRFVMRASDGRIIRHSDVAPYVRQLRGYRSTRTARHFSASPNLVRAVADQAAFELAVALTADPAFAVSALPPKTTAAR